MTAHDDFQELIPMYALGALPEADKLQLQAHLKECAACRKLYRKEQAIVEMLPRAAEPVQPSPDAKLKLFARVDADLAQANARARTQTAPRALAPKVKRSWFARPAFIFAVIGALALLALGSWLLLQNRPSPEQQQIAEILANPNVRHVALKGTKDAPGASAEMYMVPGHSVAVLQVQGLHQLPADQAYEFWFIRGQDPQPSDVFTVNPDGTMTVLVKASDKVENYNAWGVTIEPKAGVPNPTGPLVIAGGG